MVVMGVNLATEDIVISIYGGTSWEQITDKFLIGASSTYAVNATGGSTTATPSGTNSSGAVQSHILTISEIPSHKHVENFSGLTHVSSSSTKSYDGSKSKGNYADMISDANQYYKVGTDSTGGGVGHTHGFTQPTFTGKSMSILNPYYAVYIWIRTA